MTTKRRRKTLNARALASRVLASVYTSDAFANDLLSRQLNRLPNADPRDRALATELVYGTLRQQRRLDYTLSRMVRQKLTKLEPVALALLRLGAYQILCLERIPMPIAVSATQDAAREMGLTRLTGLINAVLRRLGRDGEALPEGNSHQAIGVRTSLPKWVVAELANTYGEKNAEQEGLALRNRATTTVRPNARLGTIDALAKALEPDGFSVIPGAHGTAVISGPGDPFSSHAFQQGAFLPQDPASLAVVDAVEATAGMRVLDLCSGRGIKATALAERGSRVLCVDIDRKKLEASQALAKKHGVEHLLEHRQADVTEDPLDIGTFDRVLVDAPCSGLGTARRHPELIWRSQPEDPKRLAELQTQLLTRAAEYVAPGGRLIYAVCTFTGIEGTRSVPSHLIPLGPVHITRASEDMDAFQWQVWERKT